MNCFIKDVMESIHVVQWNLLKLSCAWTLLFSSVQKGGTLCNSQWSKSAYRSFEGFQSISVLTESAVTIFPEYWMSRFITCWSFCQRVMTPSIGFMVDCWCINYSREKLSVLFTPMQKVPWLVKSWLENLVFACIIENKIYCPCKDNWVTASL